MPIYFRGWRRRIGATSLLLACVMTGLWVRSLSVLDYLETPVGLNMSVVLVTYTPFFALFIDHDPDINLPLSSARWMSQPTAKLTTEDIAGMDYSSLRQTIKYRHHPPVVPKGPNQPFQVPKLSSSYWLIGLPISYLFAILPTLLAAYLLLTQPKQPQSEPAPGAVKELETA